MTLHQLAKMVLPNICTGKYIGATAELCRRVLKMDNELEVAIDVVKTLNEASEGMNGCTLFHIEHLPGSLTRIMKGDTVCWDTEDEHAEDCDGSEESIIQHIITVLEEEVSADTNMIEVYKDSE